MFTARKSRVAFAAAILAGVALVATGCSSGDPLADDTGAAEAGGDVIAIGSAEYYSNAIIAEIYAQALENAGFEVSRDGFNAGQRDSYMPAVESGEITLIPEYTGNLLQFFDPETEARTSEDVYAALPDVLPEGLSVLEQSTATDQDSYTVTKAFADANSLVEIGDLASVSTALTLGGPPELAERPYGPSGLLETYGVTVGFSPTATTTLDALLAGTIQVANIYTADPAIQTNDLVVLEDPEGLFLASNVVPLVSGELPDGAAEILNAISAALTPEGLVALNVQSTVDELNPDEIATQWLTENGLI
ncbi:ABC transporter substrate-binding protein [Microbacterium sp. zg.B48]|uniref:ABC transporter substrate-binding protein n=1 Tax=unclassified Microbacterium TaxID=2609290 RepID=UPI00214AEDF6|nr:MULTISPECIES: ABC transporter substrate-binding protein [unclassified Microbacterium]MCR2762344.1 ABC transporter substrate-binding protein [Microbacterium sp. zg.B48]MCR2809650.1 ABC transporter substrate-binding protein [Microbacterium sp. zg.B185]WIM18026.1 ABC transporter substrate-binding protein [Microbacterium sp. zg-B185]